METESKHNCSVVGVYGVYKFGMLRDTRWCSWFASRQVSEFRQYTYYLEFRCELLCDSDVKFRFCYACSMIVKYVRSRSFPLLFKYHFGRYNVQVSSKRVAGLFWAITLNGTDITVKRLHINVKTFSADSTVIFANNGVCAIQSYCPLNKPADLPLFYWRPVHVFVNFVCTTLQTTHA